VATTRIRKAPQPVADAVYKEVEKRRALFQERDAVMHNIRRYRLMRQSTRMPKAYARRLGGKNGVKLPIMYRLVQTAVSSVAKRFPTVYVEPMSIGDRKAAADMTRAAPLLLQAIDRMAGRPYLYGLYYTLFGDGLGVTKTQPGSWSGFPLPREDEDLGDYNERVTEFLRAHPLPFVSRTVDPLTFYPPLNEYGDGVAIESAWRATSGVMRALGMRATENGLGFRPANEEEIGAQVPAGKPYPDLELPPGFPPSIRVDEIWSDDQMALCVQGSEDVWIFDNPLGEKPYTWGFADPTGVEDPANIGMSVAYPLYYIAPWVDTMVGIMTAWSLFAAPTPYTTQDPVPGLRPTQETKSEVYQPGLMYHFATGRKPGVLSPPDVGAPVLQYLNFLIESSERGGLPALVSGAGVGTRLPALTFQAAFEAATDRLKPAVQEAEKIIGGTLEKALRIIGRYEVPVKTNGWEYRASDGSRTRRAWSTIRPAEARKDRRVVVSLAVDSTQDLIAKGTHAQFMMNAELWDVTQAMRFSGVENPEDMKDQIDADKARRMMAAIMAEAEIMSDPEMAAVLRARAEAEGGGEGGEPPGPGRNRKGVPAGRGGGKRGGPTQKPRGNRQGTGKSRGRT
jgi:hypothetical protein